MDWVAHDAQTPRRSEPPAPALLETCWRAVRPSRKELSCGLYRNTAGLEQPRLLRGCFEAFLAEGMATRSQILAELPVFQSDIETLCGLPNGYLDEDFGSVVLLGVRGRFSS